MSYRRKASKTYYPKRRLVKPPLKTKIGGKARTLGEIARSQSCLDFLRREIGFTELDIARWLKNPVRCPFCHQGLLSFPDGWGWISHLKDCKETSQPH